MKIPALIASAALAISSILTAAPAAQWAADRCAAAAQPNPNPVLVGVRAAHHDPPDDPPSTAWSSTSPADCRRTCGCTTSASSSPTGRVGGCVPGRAMLTVRFSRADAHDASGPTAPARVAFTLPNVMTAVRAGDFEASRPTGWVSRSGRPST